MKLGQEFMKTVSFSSAMELFTYRRGQSESGFTRKDIEERFAPMRELISFVTKPEGTDLQEKIWSDKFSTAWEAYLSMKETIT
jgi:hypothetical protein